MNINLDQMINRDWDQIIMSPIETGCAVLKRAGGFYMSGCHVIDGQKQVCLDNYSHGQVNDSVSPLANEKYGSHFSVPDLLICSW